MRRVTVVVASLALAACSGGVASETTTTSTTTGPPTTTLPPTTTTTSAFGRAIGGQLVRLSLPRFEPVHGLDPIPFGLNAWSLMSNDGEWVVIFDWAKVTPIEVATWAPTGTFDISWHSARVVDGDRLYMYDEVSGQVLAMELETGEESRLGSWRTGLWMWDELHLTSDGLITSLGGRSSDDELGTSHWVLWLDPVTGESGDIELGPIERMEEETGVFDGDYEIPKTDSPGVVWGDSRVYIAHADPLEVKVVDLANRTVETHQLEATSWIDRLLAFWMPTAVAKGPSMGTYSSAALSADGRFLFISGNRSDVVTTDDGFLDEESVHLGLTVVDTDTWQVVARPELPIQFIRNARDIILGVDTTSTAPWMDNIYVMSIDERGSVSHQGPFGIEGGSCEPTRDVNYLICSEPVGDAQRLRLVDLQTSETIDGPEIGWEDYLHDNGVLVDWSPVEG